MAFEIWLAYVFAAIVIVVIPGPTTLLVVTQTLAHGRRAIMPLLFGVLCGDSVAVSLSILGLGALLSSSAILFAWVKWLGAAYLIYLGIALWRNSDSTIIAAQSPAKQTNPTDTQVRETIATSPSRARHAFFLHAFVVTTFNPKGILFFIAFLPQFVDATANVQQQLFILAITFIIIGSANALLYAVFANRLRILLENKTARRCFNRGGGVALVGAGLWAATVQRL